MQANIQESLLTNVQEVFFPHPVVLRCSEIKACLSNTHKLSPSKRDQCLATVEDSHGFLPVSFIAATAHHGMAAGQIRIPSSPLILPFISRWNSRQHNCVCWTPGLPAHYLARSRRKSAMTIHRKNNFK